MFFSFPGLVAVSIDADNGEPEESTAEAAAERAQQPTPTHQGRVTKVTYTRVNYDLLKYITITYILYANCRARIPIGNGHCAYATD